MLAFDLIAEQRIREAQERGEFDHLPCAGKPLTLDDDPLVPEEMRAALRVLRNAGCVPPEIEALREMQALRQTVAEAVDDDARAVARRRLEALAVRLAESGRPGLAGAVARPYVGRVLLKLAGGAS